MQNSWPPNHQPAAGSGFNVPLIEICEELTPHQIRLVLPSDVGEHTAWDTWETGKWRKCRIPEIEKTVVARVIPLISTNKSPFKRNV